MPHRAVSALALVVFLMLTGPAALAEIIPTISVDTTHLGNTLATQTGFTGYPFRGPGEPDVPLVQEPGFFAAGIISYEGLYVLDVPLLPGQTAEYRYTIADPGSSVAHDILALVFTGLDPDIYAGYNMDLQFQFTFYEAPMWVEPLYGPPDLPAGPNGSVSLNGVIVNYSTPTNTPEPCTLLLTGLGLAGAAAWRRKRPRRAA